MQTLLRIMGRFCLRFLCFYWICFTFPFPLDLIQIFFGSIDPDHQPAWMKAAGEVVDKAFTWVYDLKNEACKWVGDQVFHVEVIIQPTGSGDTLRAYVGCFCALVIAAGLTFLWTLILGLRRCKANPEKGTGTDRPDRSQSPFPVSVSLVRVLVRFFLAVMFFGYGFAKVFPLQFPPPGSYRLSEQLGDMSPMGLLWTFMGFSPIYEIFTGGVEVLAGLLLTMRRTTLLGALVGMAAMTQIFILNMCFDVPVKLYSFHYLMMAAFLAAPELPRLVNGFVLGRAVPPLRLAPLLGSRRWHRLALTFRTLLVAVMLASQIQGGYQRWQSTYGALPLPVGRWDVTRMQIDGQEPSPSDPQRWTWLEFSNKFILRLAGPTPAPVAYRMTWNTDNKELTLAKIGGSASSATFGYDLSEAEQLELRGTMDGKDIVATLQRAPEKQYPLITRGFHWVQELPYNR
jgi:hypothetical protein